MTTLTAFVIAIIMSCALIALAIIGKIETPNAIGLVVGSLIFFPFFARRNAQRKALKN